MLNFKDMIPAYKAEVQLALNELTGSKLELDGVIGIKTLTVFDRFITSKGLINAQSIDQWMALGFTPESLAQAYDDSVELQLTTRLLERITGRKSYAHAEIVREINLCLELFEMPKDVIRHFLAQAIVESNLKTHKAENMRYSPNKLVSVFGRHHPAVKVDPEAYAYNPVKLANEVYGNRMGNDGYMDGYTYRARGIIGITGKHWYKVITEVYNEIWDEDIDYVKHPNLLLLTKHAVRASMIWWYLNEVDILITSSTGSAYDVVKKVTRKVQGGSLLLARRYDVYKKLTKLT